MKLIVGLGNPGKEYENTRHNIGFWALDNYLDNVSFKHDKLADVYKDNSVIYIKPNTFMNLSGEAVKYYMNYFKIDKKDLLVIQDDLDLPLGKIRVKNNSSAGGHNGIKSIINEIGSNEFLRLKVGISKNSKDIVDYVLGKFSKEEREVLNNSCNVINSVIKDNYNKKETIEITFKDDYPYFMLISGRFPRSFTHL